MRSKHCKARLDIRQNKIDCSGDSNSSNFKMRQIAQDVPMERPVSKIFNFFYPRNVPMEHGK